jgi:hypothetical protein
MVETQLVEDLYALEEPWRTRFLVLIAELATGRRWHDQTPSRSTTEAWLLEHAWLQKQISQMLEDWPMIAAEGEAIWQKKRPF